MKNKLFKVEIVIKTVVAAENEKEVLKYLQNYEVKEIVDWDGADEVNVLGEIKNIKDLPDKKWTKECIPWGKGDVLSLGSYLDFDLDSEKNKK